MGTSIVNTCHWLERHSAWILVSGVALAGLVNILQGRKDRQAVERTKANSPELPILYHFPRISFLVPAWNEADHLPACIDSIFGLRYPQKELILCAGGQDGSFHVAQQYAGQDAVVLEQQAGEGKQKSLQRCFEHSKGEIIFLTDADSILDDGSFERTIQPLIDGSEQACTGSRRPLVGQEQNSLALYQWINHLYQESLLPDYLDTTFGINAAVTRPALEKAAGFASPAPIGTDLALGRRLDAAGIRIRYIPQSRVQTDYKITPKAYVRQVSRWARNRLFFGPGINQLNGTVAALRASIGSLFLLAVPLSGGLGQSWLWSLWGALFCNSMFAELRMVAVAIKTNPGLSLRPSMTIKFPFYMILSWLGMTLGFVENFTFRHRHKW